ncbi:MAG: hypothetical protein A3J38_10750 [Gammaproteobacteria bacterium RIFCSPHIGHO2_12_FULL_45_9]|nr:MAG: hypothetical protein A3J38_10750 [Gammaproteobacteria bacterium RIFCSPHIGHO2_12_FULL_45_9]
MKKLSTQSLGHVAGAQILEYALLIAMVAMPVSLGLSYFADSLNQFFNYAGHVVASWRFWY